MSKLLEFLLKPKCPDPDSFLHVNRKNIENFVVNKRGANGQGWSNVGRVVDLNFGNFGMFEAFEEVRCEALPGMNGSNVELFRAWRQGLFGEEKNQRIAKMMEDAMQKTGEQRARDFIDDVRFFVKNHV